MRNLIVLTTCSLFLLCACKKEKKVENISEPLYFFKWSAETNTGQCINNQGAEGYNPRFIGPCGDLRGYDFNSLSSLNGVDLRGAILDGMDLSGFSLNGANMTGVKARGTIFDGSELSGAKLAFGHFEGSSFQKVDLNGAYLQHANFSGASFQKSSLYGVDLSHADIGGAKFTDDLNTVKFRNSLISYGTQIPFDEKSAEDRGILLGNVYHMKNTKKSEKSAEGEVLRSPTSQEKKSSDTDSTKSNTQNDDSLLAEKYKN